MKHDPRLREPDTADLIAVVRLARMTESTRAGTLAAVRLVRVQLGDGEAPVSEVFAALEAPTEAMRAAARGRWTQTASDLRRARRAWDDIPRRTLALDLRGRLPNLSDVMAAAPLHLKSDEAKRASQALEALALAHDASPSDISATAIIVEDLLRQAKPETFGVATPKSLENKRSLVRRAVRILDPLVAGGREADVKALPTEWQVAVEAASDGLADHALGPRAIIRRLAVFAAERCLSPAALTTECVGSFVERELACHAETYVEKLRMAFRAWNAAVAAGLPGVELSLPRKKTHRQPETRWQDVPAEIREPVDAILDRAVSARSLGDWGNLVDDAPDPDDAELGLGCLAAARPADDQLVGVVVLELGTRKNWRDAVKRCWRAAADDPRVAEKPKRLEDLFRTDVVTALVRGVRSTRRDRSEAQGRTSDPAAKGSYEHTLVEALCSVGRATGVDPARLAHIEELKRELDPKVIAKTLTPQGEIKRKYAKRRIGPRHATMLRQFVEGSALRRWLEAPPVTWDLACQPLRTGGTVRAAHVACARTALIVRLGQYAGPMRRTSFARLRHDGDDPHILLPEGPGEGMLHLPAVETKSFKNVTVVLDPETVAMLRFYIKHFLPVARRLANAKPGNPHLFAGAAGREPEEGGYAPGFGYITKTKLNNTFRKHMRKYCGLDLCLHVMRHLAGKIILDQDPSAMALVQQLLGHEKIETTQAYYAEVCQLVAQKRYLHLLDASARRVLANTRFTLVDPVKRKDS